LSRMREQHVEGQPAHRVGGVELLSYQGKTYGRSRRLSDRPLDAFAGRLREDTDFAKIVEIFETHGVSFVAVSEGAMALSLVQYSSIQNLHLVRMPCHSRIRTVSADAGARGDKFRGRPMRALQARRSSSLRVVRSPGRSTSVSFSTSLDIAALPPYASKRRPRWFLIFFEPCCNGALRGRAPKSKSNCCAAVMERAAQALAVTSTEQPRSSVISMSMAVRCANSQRSATSTRT